MSAVTEPTTAAGTGSLPTDPAEIARLDRAHVFHSWSAQDKVDPMVVVGGEGNYVIAGDGRRYLDFSGQLVFTNIGHQHPRVTEAIAAQAAQLCTTAPAHATAAKSEAARLIAELTPGDLDSIFFTNGGAEATEHAIRMARQFTGRNKILSRYRSYHGATQTAINVTGDERRWPSDTATAGTVHFFGPFLYRSVFHAETPEQERDRALEHLEQTIRMEGPDTIAAVMLETIPGTAGIMPPPEGYLAGVRRICDRYGVLLILDEVMAGFGRTGRWLALDHYDVTPDLMTFAKGVTAGYVPLGGVAISRAIRDHFGQRPYPGGLTYSGHPLACAAAVATITTMRAEGMIDNADRIGSQVLGPGLAEIAQRHRSVGEARGIGVFWALDLVADQETREPLGADRVAATVAACKAAGLLPFTAGNRIHVVPSCTISDDEARQGLAILDEALAVADGH
ncbi:taurine--2-oxoglutarate transaminase [Naumannella cuiyingiana]|uniref:Taurine--2-oxoglutarate transaminase n=1 Tax=Naumannella cuiyingiana TaxID=1347891 RepID=A0A7Z0D677_9ACTN|nr:aspartate aminotransferase family protein [Naumannella cuiyingiana]NYI69614.1 taurine--2-oxoglutarate transaminase [Naumannella cuiyingiana]